MHVIRAVLALALVGVTAFCPACGEEFFGVDGSLEENGWRLERIETNDVFEVSGGVLSMRCSCCPCKGTLYSREVDLPERGELALELSVGDGPGVMHSLAVLFKLGDLLLSVRGGSLMRFRASSKPQWKCVGEHRIARMRWVPVKVVWDNVAGRITYYAGDMRIPSAAEQGHIVPEPGTGRIRVKVGNYGIDGTVFTHRIRGLSIGAADRESSSGAPDRRMAIVFHGLGAEFFPLDSWLAGFAVGDRVDFYLSFRGSQYLPENNMLIDGYPEKGILDCAKLIILADMPLSAEVLPYEVQTNMLLAVSEGARLIVTDGLVGLEKCGDLEAPVAKAIPDMPTSPWKVGLPAGPANSVRRHGHGTIEVVRMLSPSGTARFDVKGR